MRRFYEWLCGYVCICVNGRQVNRFFNLCSRNGIHLWRISYHMEQSLRANLRLRDFYDLKPYLRKTKTKLKVVSKKGFPFWCHRHPKLKWFFSICICVLCFAAYSFNYIWDIKVDGNVQVSTENIINYLHEKEVDIGIKKESVDCSGIEILLREQFHQLGWVSVYFDHTYLCIDVKESLYDTIDDVEEEYGKAYNMVSNKDARITSIVTRAGKALVEKGQLVKPGDVLVLGQNEILDDNGEVKETLYFRADALIYGDVLYEIEIPISEMEILSLKIADKYNEKMLLGAGSRKLNLYLRKLESNGATILDKKISIQHKEKSVCFLARIYVREQIGINIPVEEVREDEFE